MTPPVPPPIGASRITYGPPYSEALGTTTGQELLARVTAAVEANPEAFGRPASFEEQLPPEFQAELTMVCGGMVRANLGNRQIRDLGLEEVASLGIAWLTERRIG